MHRFIRSVLLKKGMRRDTFWANPFAYRSFLKFIPLHLDTRALLKSQYWSRAAIEHLQDERLKELFSFAPRIPYWGELLKAADVRATPSPRDALMRLPITSKQELIENGLERTIDATLLKKSDLDQTSGSTGKPLYFYQDWGASLRSCAVTERTFRTIAKERFPIMYIRARPRYGFTFYKHIWFFLRGYNSIPYRIDELRRTAQQMKHGFILYGYTSWVLELTRHLERSNEQLPVRAVMVAGEHLIPRDRAYIERTLGAKVFTLYASREVGFLGFECEHHHMHINEEWAYLEVVDGQGARLPPGREGRIVVTTFDNRVMPFIRYEIGDIGAISDTPCPCGRTLRTLTFKGRTTELIETGDGRIVSLLDLAHAMGLYPDTIHHYQIIQTENLSFTLKVVPGPLFEANKDYLEALIVRLLHPRARVAWEIVPSIPEARSGKAIYFVRSGEKNS